METSQLRYFIANVKYRTLIWASIEFSRQKIMFNSFTYVIYITFNLSPNVFCSFFVFCFFSCTQCIEWLYFSGKKKEEKLNRTGCGKAFLGSGIWPNYSVGFGKVYRDPRLDRIIVWDSGNLNGMRENAKFPNGTGFDCYSVSWIHHNLGTGCGIGEVKGLRDRNDRTSGCGTVVKMERQFGIRTPV